MKEPSPEELLNQFNTQPQTASLGCSTEVVKDEIPSTGVDLSPVSPVVGYPNFKPDSKSPPILNELTGDEATTKGSQLYIERTGIGVESMSAHLDQLAESSDLKSECSGFKSQNGHVHSVERVDVEGVELGALGKANIEEKLAFKRGGRNDGVRRDDYDGLDIKDPVELLFILDERIASGETSLHKWQIQFMLDFANGGHCKENPFQACVQACNSSGKDKYVIAACAVWLCMRYRDVECPITSSSGTQLDNQTGAHIDRLCFKFNAIFGPFWKINYRYYAFKHTGEFGEPCPSELKLFATDEAGKAEGYHPKDAGKRMAIFTSETKSIPSTITDAIERCHGYTHRVDASSPGIASGYFYDTCTTAIPRESIEDIKSLDSTQTILYKITAYDCPHITKSEIERSKVKMGGENGALFKSSIKAEFGSTDEMVVIPSDFVWQCVENLPTRKVKFNINWEQEEYNQGGLDLSDGGAETVLTIRNGNKHIGTEAFQFEDSEDSIDYLEELFKKWHLTSKNALIRGDYCGLGGPMLRSLKRRKWSNIRFIDSRNKAVEPKTYKNRGTELFFHMKELLQNKNIILMYDKLLIDQLCSRYYKLTEGLIYQLLSKQEMRAKGFKSPDRADSLNLCFWNFKSTLVSDDDIKEPFKEVEIQKTALERFREEKELTKQSDFDMREWANRTESKYQPVHLESDDIREELISYNRKRNNNKQLIGVN